MTIFKCNVLFKVLLTLLVQPILNRNTTLSHNGNPNNQYHCLILVWLQSRSCAPQHSYSLIHHQCQYAAQIHRHHQTHNIINHNHNKHSNKYKHHITIYHHTKYHYKHLYLYFISRNPLLVRATRIHDIRTPRDRAPLPLISAKSITNGKTAAGRGVLGLGKTIAPQF